MNEAFILRTNQGNFFTKWNLIQGKKGMFRAEKKGLAALAAAFYIAVERAPGSVGYAIRTGALCVASFIFTYGCFGPNAGFLSRALAWTPLRCLGVLSLGLAVVFNRLEVSFSREV